MDIFRLTKSHTRKAILKLFLTDPEKIYYLQELKRKLSLSAGNIRRELLHLVNLGLFQRIPQGRLVYYKIDTESPIFTMIKSLNHDGGDIVQSGFQWVAGQVPVEILPEWHCHTRDVFQARLESFTLHLEKHLGTDAYLVSAIAGEIGNNSFDHNLGSWPDVPGVYFAHDELIKTIVLADRGQGILKTIKNVQPETKDDKEALRIAFTKIVSGRSPEKRGNGLKFVVSVLKNKNWSLQFNSGLAQITFDEVGKMRLMKKTRRTYGCIAIIKY